MNNIIISGRLTRDPETATLQNGVKRTKAVVRADRVEFIGGGQNTAQNQNDGVKPTLTPADDEDCPF